jgi:DtxR family Mn-dependent transcriptional regulator
MNKKRDKDEYFEQLWLMREKNISAIDELKKKLHVEFNAQTLQELIDDNMVETDDKNHAIKLTDKGEKEARQVIRAHRLAERLISDVLGEEYEAGAGEFEHTINLELVDGICTLLGHPRECPHGRPIPEGECCKRSDKTAQASVVPLPELEVGQSAKIAYVQCRDDQQMHRMDGLQIRPGVMVKLHQKYPTIVIECEGASIALDNDVASNIRVWAKDVTEGAGGQAGKGGLRRFGFRHRRGKG